jgi:hypothetical protein
MSDKQFVKKRKEDALALAQLIYDIYRDDLASDKMKDEDNDESQTEE